MTSTFPQYDCDIQVRAQTDRIEELVERNKELALQLLATQGQAADHIEALIAERAAAEAKLAKAVEALDRLIALNDDYSPFGGELLRDRIDRTWQKARAALAEIKSGIATTPYGLEGENHE